MNPVPTPPGTPGPGQPTEPPPTLPPESVPPRPGTDPGSPAIPHPAPAPSPPAPEPGPPPSYSQFGLLHTSPTQAVDLG